MGITGLLPALKPIQITKHLSEFSGQTWAVDGYVWLHRGIMTCATELATRKPTHKYVDYCMHRVRVLSYYKIEPYIVFDGGPLPAKKGTETERKKKREDSLARANALAAQGKHQEAREYYAKCVDVTPQMAFQFIKALRAENVRYVVAPYEADAQLAYLERIELVNGILTEDSDLLVFGCRNVFFKLDVVENTVVSVMRKDFGSVSRPESDISLIGWSDAQFRAMSILSGCDYLPSIPGIGLKTACSMLRKWKTAEQVVRAVLLEGKKVVPRGYMDQFRLADKCFQHQRVFCPNQEKIVYLNAVDSDWDDKAEAYVGSDLDPSIAKQLAEGDLDPITLTPMEDINPTFIPRPKFPVSVSRGGSQKDKGKGKAVATSKKHGGILSFFGPNPIIPRRETGSSSKPTAVKDTKKFVTGKASGKRTLVEAMESDITAKKLKRTSKFFEPSVTGNQLSRTSSPTATAGSSRQLADKENISLLVEDDEGISVVDSVHVNVDLAEEVDLEPYDSSIQERVEQEDGYISPTSSCSVDLQDLSSPAQTRKTSMRDRQFDSEFGADTISSPPSVAKRKNISLGHRIRSLESLRFDPLDRSSDIDCSEDEEALAPPSGSKSSATPTPSPQLPLDEDHCTEKPDALDLDDPEDHLAEENQLRSQVVAKGWRKQWARSETPETQGDNITRMLWRRETNITPVGRHTIIHPGSLLRPISVPKVVPYTTTKARRAPVRPAHAERRKSLPFFQPIKNKPRVTDVIDLGADLSGEEGEPTGRLDHFRFN